MRHGLRILGLAWSASRPLLLGLGLATLAVGTLPALAAWYGKRLVDAVDAGVRHDALLYLAIEATLMALLLAATRLALHCKQLLGLQLTEEVRSQIVERAQRLDLDTLEAPEVQDELVRARKQAGSRPLSFLERVLVLGRSGVAIVAGAAIVVGLYAPALPLVLLAALPGFAVELRAARARYLLQRRRTAMRREQNYLENILSREDFAKEVRLLELGPPLVARFRALGEALYAEEAAEARRAGRGAALAGIFGTLAFYGAYLGVVLATVAGRFTLGEMTMALVVFRQLQQALEALLGAVGGMSEDRLYLTDLFGFLDREAEADVVADAGLTSGPRPGEGLRFEGVTFTYPGSDSPALRDVSFELRPGAVLGIVGENGCGKTTLLKLLTRLYEVQEGRVTLDGLDLRAWSRRSLRRRMAAVLQDFSRYKLTVGENIGLGEVEAFRALADPATPQAMARWLAAAEAGEADFVPRLGLEQRLGRSFPGGVGLSGGQWQRLALARAFVRESADVRVFDEPTASLDARAEAAVFDRLYGNAAGNLTIVVAHRLAALTRADEILVLREGRVVERGSHRELLRAGGEYARNFRLQRAHSARGAADSSEPPARPTTA